MKTRLWYIWMVQCPLADFLLVGFVPASTSVYMRLTFAITLAILSFATTSLRAQHINWLKIDPDLHRVIPSEETDRVLFERPTIVDSTARNLHGTQYYHCKVYADVPEHLETDYGIEVMTVLPRFVTAFISSEEIRFLSTQEDVKYIEAPKRVYLKNDHTRGRTGAALLQAGGLNATTYKGAGVIVAVIDAGVDWQHADFIDPSNSTSSRILRLWDQELTVTGGEKTPNGNDATLTCCNYGVEYLKSAIDAELASSSGSIRNADASNHGTHVLGTAAGNGNSLSPAQHVGMAPEADIIFVNTLFTDASIIDALDYLEKKASDESKPIVVNMSLGSDDNAHDGTSSLAQAVDAFCTTGQLVVISAGNEGDDGMHVSGTIPEDDSVSISITVPSYTANSGSSNDFFLIAVWYENGDSVIAHMVGPNGSRVINPVNTNTGINTSSDGAVILNNSVNANNSDRTHVVQVFDFVSTNPPATGTYQLKLHNANANPPYSNDITYHAWLHSSQVGSEIATFASGDNTYIVGSPGSAKEALTVGAYVHAWRWQNHSGSSFSYSGTELSDDLAAFSSSGPLRDGTTKPEIAAPGQGTGSSLSAFSSASNSRQLVGQKHYVTQGTSMSSPAVAGAAALLFQQNSSYTAAQVKTLITDNARTDTYTGSVPNNSWGYGKLDIFKSMCKAVNGSSTPSREMMVYDSWANSATVALSGSQQVALKFTPNFSGKVSSIFFHTSTSSISLSGDITFAIYDDNSGVPGTQIGTSFTFDDAKIFGNRWFNVEADNSMSVTSGSDYYVVVNLANSGDSWGLLAETSSVDNRTLINGGSGWSTQSFDVRIRPIVVDGSGVTVLPVDLLDFKAEAIDEDVLLQWRTATEINNQGFEVQQRLGDGFVTIGFVPGSGTTYTERRYSHRVSNLGRGTHYFRLRQVDYNGNFGYSPVVSVTLGQPQSASRALVYPNPVAEVLHVEWSEGEGYWSLFTSQGLEVNTGSLSYGLNQIMVQGLPAGMYYLDIQGLRYPIFKQ